MYKINIPVSWRYFPIKLFILVSSGPFWGAKLLFEPVCFTLFLTHSVAHLQTHSFTGVTVFLFWPETTFRCYVVYPYWIIVIVLYWSLSVPLLLCLSVFYSDCILSIFLFVYLSLSLLVNNFALMTWRSPSVRISVCKNVFGKS